MQDCQEETMVREAVASLNKCFKNQQWIEQWEVARIQNTVKLCPLKILFVLKYITKLCRGLKSYCIHFIINIVPTSVSNKRS